MTENESQPEEREAYAAISPPQTGHPPVDDALVGLAELSSAPLSEHHDRLAKAHQVLQEALDRGDDDRPDAEPD